eukprot:scaffold2655_cov400-Prasinococcus_capsulatus_cf.AAC.8
MAAQGGTRPGPSCWSRSRCLSRAGLSRQSSSQLRAGVDSQWPERVAERDRTCYGQRAPQGGMAPAMTLTLLHCAYRPTEARSGQHQQ